MYLRVRAPLLINSNYYICDAYAWKPTHQQVARAANVIHNITLVKVTCLS